MAELESKVWTVLVPVVLEVVAVTVKEEAEMVAV